MDAPYLEINMTLEDFGWAVLIVIAVLIAIGTYAHFLGLILDEQRTMRFWARVEERFEAFTQRHFWGRIFPMSPRRFDRFTGWACKSEEYVIGTVHVTRETLAGLTAVFKVETPAFTRPVVVTYQDFTYCLICRAPCPPPGLHPPAGDGWSVAQEGEEHYVTAIDTMPDLGKWPEKLHDRVLRAARMPDDIAQRIETFNNALSS
jgi:hypothetical protein